MTPPKRTVRLPLTLILNLMDPGVFYGPAEAKNAYHELYNELEKNGTNMGELTYALHHGNYRLKRKGKL